MQCIGSCINILLYGACESTNHRAGYRLRNLDNRIKIAGAGDREPGFNDIDTQFF